MSDIKVNKVSPIGTAFQLGESGDTITIPSGATILNSGTATNFGDTLPAHGTDGNVLTSTGSAWASEAAAGGGKILQVSPTPVQLTGRITTTSTSYVAITGMTLAITPSATSSRILILIQGGLSQEGSGWSTFVQLLRDSTVIGSGTGTIREDCIASHEATSYQARNSTPLGIMWLDSPSSTSSVTYSLKFRVNGGTGVLGGAGQSGVEYGETGSHITLLEIGA